MGVMRVLDATGDTMVTWSLDDAATLQRATAMFDREVRAGKLAFAVPSGRRETEAERIKQFDPRAEEIIWVRALQGG
jgi:hypothetical protein